MSKTKLEVANDPDNEPQIEINQRNIDELITNFTKLISQIVSFRSAFFNEDSQNKQEQDEADNQMLDDLISLFAIAIIKISRIPKDSQKENDVREFKCQQSNLNISTHWLDEYLKALTDQIPEEISKWRDTLYTLLTINGLTKSRY